MNDDLELYEALKDVIKAHIERTGEDVDVCELKGFVRPGIGYNELRYIMIEEDGELGFESNLVHDWERGDDTYRVFHWHELSTYEREMMEYLFIKKRRLSPDEGEEDEVTDEKNHPFEIHLGLPGSMESLWEWLELSGKK
ncbi:MAG: hypothetical protein Q4B58_08260 [Bacteroidales bacterium]|nr:hypothetical protein [Bacteroidales bacterium]